MGICTRSLLRCVSRLVARNGPPGMSDLSPESAPKRTSATPLSPQTGRENAGDFPATLHGVVFDILADVRVESVVRTKAAPRLLQIYGFTPWLPFARHAFEANQGPAHRF